MKALHKPKKVGTVLLPAILLAILATGVFLALHHMKSSPSGGSQQPKKSAEATAPTQNSLIPKTGGSKTNSGAPAKPEFTVYYPQRIPSDLVVDISTISYSKNYFTFSVAQKGRDQFYVNEQPASGSFSYKPLKKKLTTPNNVGTALGEGIIGTLGTNFVTAVKTDKNTLIIVNCTALSCLGSTLSLINSLKINTDPTHIAAPKSY